MQFQNWNKKQTTFSHQNAPKTQMELKRRATLPTLCCTMVIMVELGASAPTLFLTL